MKRLLLIVALLLLPWPTSAQTFTRGALLSSTSCPGTGCFQIPTNGLVSVAVQVTGTFVGTLTFQASVDGETFVSLLMTPSSTTTGATTTTGTGAWNANVAGYTIVRVAFTSLTSGTALVTISAAGR